jgi:hypothetical protein
MHDPKSKHAHEREALMALMALAARHRAERARALEAEGALWQCGRGHAWDDGVSAA